MQQTNATSEAIVRPRTMHARILVVDDEADAGEALRQVLQLQGYAALSETSPHCALERIAAQDFELIVTDVAMADMNGLELCQRIVETRPRLPVILISGRGNMEMVISALRLGARDFLTKPIDAEALLATVGRTLHQHAPEDMLPGSPETVSEFKLLGLPGKSARMRQIYKLIADLSASRASVLIQGETGTGKEIIARAVHENSQVHSGPFVAINCAAMPAGLLESELFGHARGAYTDARTAKKGLLVEANGGTLLLDEIGELPIAMQPKLLRALQERTVRPIGESKEVPFDCRIIVATNRDLEDEVSHKRFREDLFYRINVVRIPVPPLRERGEDILLLAHYFLDRFASKSGRHLNLPPSVAQKLLAYSWPGNVRELENCIERAVTLSRFDELSVEDLPDKVRSCDIRHDERPEKLQDPRVVPLLDLERHHILSAIKLVGGNKKLAAELLGIDRRTLYRRLAQYDADRSN